MALGNQFFNSSVFLAFFALFLNRTNLIGKKIFAFAMLLSVYVIMISGERKALLALLIIFYFVLGNIIPFAVFLFLFLFRMNDTDIKYENKINKDFEYVSLTKETFTRGLVFISNFIAIVAVKFEYLITFNKSEDNFSVYNFNITVETGADIETLYSSLNKTGGKR